MSREQTIAELKEQIKNIKDIEEVYAIFYMMLERDFTDEEIAEVLNEMRLPEDVKEEIEKANLSLK